PSTQIQLPHKCRLIICCDGTASSEYIGDRKSPITNVSRIARAINKWGDDTKEIRQIVRYLPGIGTNELNLKGSNLANQASGKGTWIKSLILEAYAFLSHNHATENDEIFLIGFSRGAFAMRCLADFLLKCGLLAKEDLDNLVDLYTAWKDDRGERENRKHVKIKVCALWDTVATVRDLLPRPRQILSPSQPNRKFHFVHSNLLDGIENTFQALSLHEHRYHFFPIVLKKVEAAQILEQCWFAGYHGDVGGGGKNEILSHFALIWIIGKLHNFLSISVDQLWTHQGPSAWNIPDERELRAHDSMTWKWKFMDSRFRRPCCQFTNEHGAVTSTELIDTGASMESVHFSAGLLQYWNAFKPFGALHKIQPEEREFSRPGQTRSWVLFKPGKSIIRKYRNKAHDKAVYEIKEQSMDEYERLTLLRWVNYQLKKRQTDMPRLGDPRPNTILAILKGYLEDPARDE
ncbi:hypothetical protein PG984_005209, partial [Apiospora sp. TS-2023a]